MNTSIEYFYRDAGNYKTFETVVIKGVLSRADIQAFLYDKQFFIPSQVGMTDLQPELWTELDHVWHELDVIEQTTEQPTTPLTAHELIHAFRDAKKDEWQKGLAASIPHWF